MSDKFLLRPGFLMGKKTSGPLKKWTPTILGPLTAEQKANAERWLTEVVPLPPADATPPDEPFIVGG